MHGNTVQKDKLRTAQVLCWTRASTALADIGPSGMPGVDNRLSIAPNAKAATKGIVIAVPTNCWFTLEVPKPHVGFVCFVESCCDPLLV